MHWLILKYISAFVLSQDAHQESIFQSFKNYLNVLIEL